QPRNRLISLSKTMCGPSWGRTLLYLSTLIVIHTTTRPLRMPHSADSSPCGLYVVTVQKASCSLAPMLWVLSVAETALCKAQHIDRLLIKVRRGLPAQCCGSLLLLVFCQHQQSWITDEQ